MFPSSSSLSLRMEAEGTCEARAPIYHINGVTSWKTVFFTFNDVNPSDITSADIIINPMAPNFFGFLGVSCRKW
jgi:hypothetical protein